MALFVSPHAICRYQERVARVSDDDAYTALTCKAVLAAISFGAPYVKLSGGQRIVIEGETVITVLPSNHWRGPLNKTGMSYFGRTG